MALYSQIEDRYLAALTAVQFPEAPVADTQQPVTDATSVDGMQLAAGPSQTVTDAGAGRGSYAGFDPRQDAANKAPMGEVKPYDPTVREQLAEFLQAGFERFGMDRYKARKQAQTLIGGPNSNLPLDMGLADIVPFLGTALQTQEAVRMGGDAVTSAQQGNYGTAALQAGGAALGLVPGAAGTAKAAMAAGRAGERIAEKTVPQIMEKGGTMAELLQALSQGSRSQLTAYHGTPHNFDKFDSSKIGTGEGNQSFGYGLYFAESKDVAQAYQTTLGESKQVYTLNGKEIQRESLNEIDKLALNISARPKEYTLKALEDSGLDESAVSEVKAALDKFKGAKFKEISKGNLYTVDIPDEMVSKMLDFDKPLSQQPKNVQDALAKLGFTVDKKQVDEYSDALLSALSSDAPADLPKQPLDLSGESIYRQLTKNASSINPLYKQRDALIEKYQRGDMSMADSVRAMNAEDRAEFSRIAQAIDNTKNAAAVASEALRQAGIPGIRYLDQGSRGSGKGTRNIVVFPGGEDQVKILKQEGKK